MREVSIYPFPIIAALTQFFKDTHPRLKILYCYNQCDNMVLLQNTIQQERLNERAREERKMELESLERGEKMLEDHINKRNNQKLH